LSGPSAGLLGALEAVEPARIFAEFLARGEDLLAKFFNAPFVNEKFDAGGVAVLFFAVLAEDAADRLGEREQFLHRGKLGQQAGLARHRAESAADDNLETALEPAVDLAHRGGVADIVHLGQTAGVLSAAAESGLELAAKSIVSGWPIRNHARALA
jgi:hypothetical protein